MVKRELSPVKALSLLHTGCTVLVTCGHKDSCNIITIAWISPVSSKPPGVIISVKGDRYSYNLLKECGEYAINIPDIKILPQVHFCGTKSGKDVNKFQETNLTGIEAKTIDTLLIDECVGHLECKIVQTLDVGQHTLFVGEVTTAQVAEDYFDTFWITGRKGVRTLHYLGGRKYAPLDERVDVKDY